MTLPLPMQIGGKRVHAENIVHLYGDLLVLKEVSLDVEPGEFVTLLGPSGSGKTTLLRIIAGLVPPTSGHVRIGDVDVTDMPPEKRGVGLVFQNYALFPHLTAAENLAFPLKMRRVPRHLRRERVAAAIHVVGLQGMEERYPSQLSGGQQQRVALARAIVFQPSVLLLDEPLGALDKQLRRNLGVELRRLQREIGVTTIYVTHDQEEAFVLSNRVGVMQAGSIVQLDLPEVVYNAPKTPFVARFVGDLNDFHGRVADVSPDRMLLRASTGLELVATPHDGFSVGDRALFALRPEKIRIAQQQGGNQPAIPVLVKAVIFGGSWIRSELEWAGKQSVISESRGEAALAQGEIKEGDNCWLEYDPSDVVVFPYGMDPDTGSSGEIGEPT